jgi:hypothetical protein
MLRNEEENVRELTEAELDTVSAVLAKHRSRVRDGRLTAKIPEEMMDHWTGNGAVLSRFCY